MSGDDRIASWNGMESGPAVELLPTEVVPRRTQTNRRNALRSTGPRTVAGKARVARNALRHGILAKRTVIMEGPAREDVAEFRGLLQRLRDDLDPEGALEELLVERIASCTWRLGRVMRAESASIREALEEAPFAAEERERECDLELRDAEPEERLRTVAGIESMLTVVREAGERLRRHGALDADELARVEEVVGYALPGTGVQDERGRAGVLEALAHLEAGLEGLRARAAERAALQRERAPGLLAIPTEATATRLLKYETAIERQLYKAVHELERLQARRRGEAVAPRVHVDVEVAGGHG